MSTAKRDNYRFSFLLKLKCGPDQAADVAADLPGTVLPFSQDTQTCWISVAIDPASKPLSRFHFNGEHKGAKILARALVILLEEVTPALIDRTLKQLASDPAVTGLNPAAAAWLSQNRASAAIVADVASHQDSKDSLLQQLKRDFVGLLAA